ncbi:MAG TPA: Maf family protein [Dehalococcoidia bacterium]|nr:Maf family protein [Dehalococcoidia bacterium]
MSLVLASASPRRREILGRLGLPFAVEPSALEEETPGGVMEPAVLAQELALAKAQKVAARWPGAIIVAADTLVVDGGDILGKPRDATGGPQARGGRVLEDAAAMLRRLRGREHRVVTGVAVVEPGGHRTAALVSRVFMRPYSEEEIAAYVASGAPLDKAGAYGIQDAFQPAAACHGCYLNVVGLPLCALVELLRPLGLPIPEGLVSQDPTTCPQCRGHNA